MRTNAQGEGIGAQLLAHHGFEIVPTAEKEQLLRRYWTVPDRQIETSVVLADTTWRTLNPQ